MDIMVVFLRVYWPALLGVMLANWLGNFIRYMIMHDITAIKDAAVLTLGSVLIVLFFVWLAALIDIIEFFVRLLKKRFIKIERFEVAIKPPEVPAALAVCNVRFSNGVEINPRVYYHEGQKKYRGYLHVSEREDEKKIEMFGMYYEDILREAKKHIKAEKNDSESA
jgi:hypothetical protein